MYFNEKHISERLNMLDIPNLLKKASLKHNIILVVAVGVDKKGQTWTILTEEKDFKEYNKIAKVKIHYKTKANYMFTFDPIEYQAKYLMDLYELMLKNVIMNKPELMQHFIYNPKFSLNNTNNNNTND